VNTEMTEVMRWLLAWKRNWDQTGIPPAGTHTYVTHCDRGLYEAVRQYEAAAVAASLAT
jgi:hypothetical protein